MFMDFLARVSICGAPYIAHVRPSFRLSVRPSASHTSASGNKKAVLSQRWPRDARYISGSNEPLRRYGHSILSKMAACRQLGFDVTGNSAVQSADPENHTL